MFAALKLKPEEFEAHRKSLWRNSLITARVTCLTSSDLKTQSVMYILPTHAYNRPSCSSPFASKTFLVAAEKQTFCARFESCRMRKLQEWKVEQCTATSRGGLTHGRCSNMLWSTLPTGVEDIKSDYWTVTCPSNVQLYFKPSNGDPQL